MSIRASRVPKCIHCYVEPSGNQWQAFSLELGLAVQGESALEVKEKLERIIRSYIYDAVLGEDQEHQAALLQRRAAFSHYVKYLFYKLVCTLSQRNSGGPKADGHQRRPCTFSEAPPHLAGA